MLFRSEGMPKLFRVGSAAGEDAGAPLRIRPTFVDGALEIQTVEGEVLISKPGADGRSVWNV